MKYMLWSILVLAVAAMILAGFVAGTLQWIRGAQIWMLTGESLSIVAGFLRKY